MSFSLLQLLFIYYFIILIGQSPQTQGLLTGYPKGAFLYSLASRRRRKEKSKKLGLLKNGPRRIRRFLHMSSKMKRQRGRDLE